MEAPSRDKPINNEGWHSEDIKNVHKPVMKGQNTQLKNKRETWTDYFIKKEDQMARRHLKRHSGSSVFREMQIQISGHAIPRCRIEKVSAQVCDSKCWSQAAGAEALPTLTRAEPVQPLWQTLWQEEEGWQGPPLCAGWVPLAFPDPSPRPAALLCAWPTCSAPRAAFLMPPEFAQWRPPAAVSGWNEKEGRTLTSPLRHLPCAGHGLEAAAFFYKRPHFSPEGLFPVLTPGLGNCFFPVSFRSAGAGNSLLQFTLFVILDWFSRLCPPSGEYILTNPPQRPPPRLWVCHLPPITTLPKLASDLGCPLLGMYPGATLSREKSKASHTREPRL